MSFFFKNNIMKQYYDCLDRIPSVKLLTSFLKKKISMPYVKKLNNQVHKILMAYNKSRNGSFWQWVFSL